MLDSLPHQEELTVWYAKDEARMAAGRQRADEYQVSRQDTNSTSYASRYGRRSY